MGSKWIKFKFSELCDISRGGSPRPIHDWMAEDGIPWVKIADASASGSRFIESTGHFIKPAGKAKSREVFPGDLILSNSATPGIPKFMSIYACIHDGWMLLRDFNYLDKLFCYYLLLYERDRIVSQGTGTVFTNLKTDILKNHLVSLPPLPEQRAIAGLLGALDDKIELNRRMNQTLESMARALFKSWFIDFDPVHANARTTKPNFALFPDEFQPSDLGDIPKGWEVKRIDDLCEINSRTLSKKDKLEELEYVEISAVNRGDISSISHYQRKDAPSRARRRLSHGDTVISTVRPDRGAHFLALNPPDHRIASTGFAVLTPTSSLWAFLYTGLTMPEVSEKLGQLADGAAYPAVKPEQIGSMSIAVPEDDALLERYQVTAAPLLLQAEANRIQSRTLAALRDALLPKLLSGELTVDAAAAEVADA